MTLQTEPIGSIPRPLKLIHAIELLGDSQDPSLEPLYLDAVRDTIERFEATGSPVVTDGEQRKYHNFWTYPVDGMPNTTPDGFKIPFSVGNARRMQRLTAGPFRYRTYAYHYVQMAKQVATMPVKQAVISPSALSLMYPKEGLTGYTREQFLQDLISEHVHEVRGCLEAGADVVQVDFTEGPLAVKLDPSGELLNSFIELNNMALANFSPQDRTRLGVHACPGSMVDSTDPSKVDFCDLLPSLFQLNVRNFYVALARESERVRVLKVIAKFRKPEQHVFVGVVDPLDPHVEDPEEICERVLQAAEYIPPAHLGTTDDCGFAPFSDAVSTTRDTAFAKIRSRVRGTEMASMKLGLR